MKYKKPMGTRVKQRSPNEIDFIAQKLRSFLGVDKDAMVCPIRIVEALQLSNACELEVTEDDELSKDVEAISYPDLKLIKVKNSVYNKACSGDARARFTIAHEIGHLVLHRDMGAFARGPAHTDYREDAEWQANMFAASFLADSRLLTTKMSVQEIATQCGLSLRAAEIRKSNFKRFNQGASTPVDR